MTVNFAFNKFRFTVRVKILTSEHLLDVCKIFNRFVTIESVSVFRWIVNFRYGNSIFRQHLHIKRERVFSHKRLHYVFRPNLITPVDILWRFSSRLLWLLFDRQKFANNYDRFRKSKIFKI